MKTYLWAGSVWLAVAAASLAAMSESSYLVEVVEFDQTAAYKLVSASEWKALQSEMKEDAKFYPKAIEAIKKMWKEDPRTQKKPFPAAAVGPRAARLIGSPFVDEEKAQAKLDAITVREAKKEAVKLEREKADQNKKNAAKSLERKAFEEMAAELLRRKMDELKGVPAKEPNQKPG